MVVASLRLRFVDALHQSYVSRILSLFSFALTSVTFVMSSSVVVRSPRFMLRIFALLNHNFHMLQLQWQQFWSWQPDNVTVSFNSAHDLRFEIKILSIVPIIWKLTLSHSSIFGDSTSLENIPATDIKEDSLERIFKMPRVNSGCYMYFYTK